MVLFVIKWDILPDRVEAYLKWTESAMRRTLAVPGVVELRAYRLAAGASQVVITYEFTDFAAWVAWYVNEDCQKVLDELKTYTTNIIIELWGPSPAVPKPVRPGG